MDWLTKFFAWLGSLFSKPVPSGGVADSKPANDGSTPSPGATPAVPPAPVSVIDGGPVRKVGSPLLSLPVKGAVPGLDISHYQPKVNWDEVKRAGFKFCFAKASDGLGTKDSMFDTHRKNAKANGLIFGAYHFMRFGGINAHDEAALFLKNSGGVLEGELPLTLDIEWDMKNIRYASGKTMDDAAAAEALEILERLESAIKMTPIVYTSYPFFNGFKNPERFARFLPWCPAYGRVAGPKVPLPWSKFVFWQHTETHPTAKLITGDANLDGDLFNGTYAQLQALTKK